MVHASGPSLVTPADPLSAIQVLYKRKPVQLLQPDKSISNNAEVHHTSPTLPREESDQYIQVWVMPKSGEVFTDYESYLKRFAYTINLHLGYPCLTPSQI